MRKIDKTYEVYDAKDKVLGRVASVVAKQLLNGKSIAVINAEQAIITGNKEVTVARYKVRLNLQEKENPDHSPYWPRRPDMLVRRIIRGMLPYHKKPSGKDAYRRLMVFQGEPKELKGFKINEIKSKDPKGIYVNYLKVGELSKLLGYNK
jgi:large subunit ribosomal protein L13